MRNRHFPTHTLPVTLAALALLGACSTGSGAHAAASSTSHHLTAAEVDAMLNPPVSKNVEHCAGMAIGKMGITSCTEHAPPKSPLAAAYPEGGWWDAQWDTSLHPASALTPLPQPGAAGIEVLVTRGISAGRTGNPDGPGVDKKLGAHYVDLWASKHAMSTRDVVMHIPDQLEPVRIEWSGVPAGTTLHAGDRAISHLPSRGAVIILMAKGDLADALTQPATLALTLLSSRSFTLPLP